MSNTLSPAEARLKERLLNRLETEFGKTFEDATAHQLYTAAALTLHDDMMKRWTASRSRQHKEKNKELYYLSFEFLMGRSFANNLAALGLTGTYSAVLESLGYTLSGMEELEADAGLGNGGLGRLAACFMDSLATLGLPAYGCSIRYEYGLFQQKIIDGYQVEAPDPWLEGGTPWEAERADDRQYVTFGGKVEEHYDYNGRLKISYTGATTVAGLPYDIPVAGKTTNTLRVWKAHALQSLNFQNFSRGQYAKAAEDAAMAEALSKVLYPEDNHYEGKSLRLKQQYFFVSCTVQWILQRYKKYHTDLSRLPDKVVIHINDTHPALAIPELMRLLMDNEGLSWDEAWDITSRTFAYTNHTVMSEALERWPQEMFRTLLPRIYMIVEEINRRLTEEHRRRYGDDWGKINYMAPLADGYVNMANLCLCTCFAVNGVSALHTDILKGRVFTDYYQKTPEKFHSITNGITFRRWLSLANPELDALVCRTIGEGWRQEPEQLSLLEPYAADSAFQAEFLKIRRANKVRLAESLSLDLDPDSMFDVQIKRLHEYKRQTLNVLHILYLYKLLKENPKADIPPRTFLFGAKASPGYVRAKLIIKLICAVADLVNNDPDVAGRLRVVFVENYGVTWAQRIIPAADLSEQISTAGKEASGTGNMKFMLNGAVTLGTLDGANVEMCRRAGAENMYIFGLTAEEAARAGRAGAAPSDARLAAVLSMLKDDTLSPGLPGLFADLYRTLTENDEYLVLRDFAAYHTAREQAARDYGNKPLWLKKSILNMARCGYFSSDRTVSEYNSKIWHLPTVEK